MQVRHVNKDCSKSTLHVIVPVMSKRNDKIVRISEVVMFYHFVTNKEIKYRFVGII